MRGPGQVRGRRAVLWDECVWALAREHGGHSQRCAEPCEFAGGDFRCARPLGRDDGTVMVAVISLCTCASSLCRALPVCAVFLVRLKKRPRHFPVSAAFGCVHPELSVLCACEVKSSPE